MASNIVRYRGVKHMAGNTVGYGASEYLVGITVGNKCFEHMAQTPWGTGAVDTWLTTMSETGVLIARNAVGNIVLNA